MSLDPNQPPKSPEQMAAEARSRLRHAMQEPGGQPAAPAASGAGAPVPPAGPPADGADGNPWSLAARGIDLEEAAASAHKLDVEAKRSIQSESSWRTRADHDQGLVEIDSETNKATTDSFYRPSDVKAAEQYGPLSRQAVSVINKYFAADECSELHFNAPDKIFAKVNGRRVQVKAEFSNEAEYNRFIEDLIERADTHQTLDKIKKRARAVVRMAGGDRMAVMFPPITEFAQAAIHKVVARTWDMHDLVKNGTLTAEMANFLVAAVRSKANILVCGEMGAGKSVMLSLLAQHIGDDERIALIEEVPEIFLNKPDVSRMTYYPATTSDVEMGLDEVLDTVLYMRMDRVIIGEIHDKGMYRMLRVMAAGSDGSLSTFHAGTAEQALQSVRNHVLREEKQIPSTVASEFIRKAVNLVVVVERVGKRHKVVEVAEVEWRNLADASDVIGLNKLFHFNRDLGPADEDGRPLGEHVRESRPDQNGKIVQKAEKYGVVLKPEWFAGSEFLQRGGRR